MFFKIGAHHIITPCSTSKFNYGKPFPKKAKATIEAYKKHGWNTTDYLIRTGNSTVLNINRLFQFQYF